MFYVVIVIQDFLDIVLKLRRRGVLFATPVHGVYLLPYWVASCLAFGRSSSSWSGPSPYSGTRVCCVLADESKLTSVCSMIIDDRPIVSYSPTVTETIWVCCGAELGGLLWSCSGTELCSGAELYLELEWTELRSVRALIKSTGNCSSLYCSCLKSINLF